MKRQEAIRSIARFVATAEAGEVELVCRNAIASDMINEGRILLKDEIVNRISAYVTAMDTVPRDDLGRVLYDGEGRCRLTEAQWNKTSAQNKTVWEGKPHVLASIDGSTILIEVEMVKESSVEIIADRISRDIHQQHFTLDKIGQIEDDLVLSAPEMTEDEIPIVPCPECDSMNATITWLDSGNVTFVCHDCGCDYTVPVAAVVDDGGLVVRDIDIDTDTFASVSDEGYEVYVGGELVTSGDAVSAVDAEEKARAWTEDFDKVDTGMVFTSSVNGVDFEIIGKGVELEMRAVKSGVKSFATPHQFVKSVREGMIVRNASADGGDIKDTVKVADVYENESGSRIEVLSSDKHNVTFRYRELGTLPTGQDFRIASKREFLHALYDDGFLLS